MSSRERWTVYPLLFLTLGIALTDKITRQVDTDQVVCKTLLVTDRLGAPQVIVGSNEAGGVVRTQGVKQGVNVTVGHVGMLAGLMFSDPDGRWIRPSLAAMRVAPKSHRKQADSKSPEPAAERKQQPQEQPKTSPEQPPAQAEDKDPAAPK